MLCVAKARPPVAGLTPHWRDSDDIDIIAAMKIDQRELELAVHNSACLASVLWPCFRRLRRLCLGSLHRSVEVLRQPRTDCCIEVDLFQELGASL